MNQSLTRRLARACIAALAIVSAGFVASCGGGGGGGGGSTGNTNVQVTGTIKDLSTQIPLQGYGVVLVGTNVKVVTDSTGSFTIPNVGANGSILLQAYGNPPCDTCTRDSAQGFNLANISQTTVGGLPTKALGQINLNVSPLPPCAPCL